MACGALFARVPRFAMSGDGCTTGTAGYAAVSMVGQQSVDAGRGLVEHRTVALPASSPDLSVACSWFSQVRKALAAVIGIPVALFLLDLLLPVVAMADGATGVQYASPHGRKEQCVMLDPMPGGNYRDEDRAQEQAFCAVDFYSGTRALCPKLFSTSPGTLVYDISRGQFAGRPDAFERAQCATSSPVKRGALGAPVSYKTTMNDAQTSATFSTASLLYYHFARYLDADVHVPVSVYRTMDKDTHLERVARRGLDVSAKRKGGAMNHAAWRVLHDAEQQPSRYAATDELFTADRQQIRGVLLQPHGDRYGPEINGTRQSGWGAGQSRDFQETAPFRALRSSLPLDQAIDAGIHEAAENETLRQAMGHGVAPEQMVFWMKELTEITLLDFILSQQDRIGNIDYLNYWYWVEDGSVRRRPADSTRVPDDLAPHHPIRLKRTQLNDNDGGGRVQYANFTKKTGMLEKLRHYSPDTYRRLIRLADDFAARGELFHYLRDSFALSEAQLRQLVDNTRAAAEIVKGTCLRGELRFDLDPLQYLLHGQVTETKVDCEHP